MHHAFMGGIGREASLDYGLEVAAALVELAGDLAASWSIDDLLRVVGAGMCRLIGVSRSSVYLREIDSATFRGRVGHAGRPIDVAVRRLIAGGAADRFTREILETRAPVVIDDARRDRRPIRRTMVEWDVRAMLGVPMVVDDEVVGLVFLDDEGVAHHFSPAEQRLAVTAAGLAGTAIQQALRAADARRSASALAAENRRLRHAAALDARLAGWAASGGLNGLAEGVTALSGLACAIHRVGSRRRVAGARRAASTPFPVLCERADSDPDVAAALADLAPGRAAVVGPFPGLGAGRRFVVAPIDLGGKRLGHVVIAEHGRRLDATDGIVGVRAARLAALELGSRRRQASLVDVTDAALARDLLGVPAPPGSLVARAAAHGVDFETSRYVVCHVTSEDPDAPLPVDAARIVRELHDQGHAGALGVDVDDGLALIVRVPGGGPPSARALKDPISKALGAVAPGRSLMAAISHLCQDASGLPEALAQCRRIAQDRASWPPDDRCALADDVGRGRLFLSSVPEPEMRRFAEGALGPILEPPGRWEHLVATLVAYVEAGRNMRDAAARMSMHENTVRYRLKKVELLTGLDVVGNPDDQLTAQLAVSFLGSRARRPEVASDRRVASGACAGVERRPA
jgi:hypothetical protein